MKVYFYKSSGFCSGVRNAVEAALRLAGEYDKVYTLGPLVHNGEVESYLEEQGVVPVSGLEEVDGGILVVRTHGVGPETLEEIQESKEVSLYDATCPRVKKVQELARELTRNGYKVLLWGSREHPEVKGVVQWTGNSATVVSSQEEIARAADNADNMNAFNAVALISQTTKDEEGFEEAAEYFKEIFPHGEVHNTICPFVKSLQWGTRKLASRVDYMVVVGSPESSNTGRLLEICRAVVPATRVSHTGELKPDMFIDAKKVGVVAGASTPDWIIKEVLEKMEEEKIEEVTQQDLENQEVRSYEEGERVKGKVAQVEDDYILVDVGYKTEAILPRAEVYLEEGASLQEKFSAEDELEVLVLRVNEDEGKIIVSHRRVEREKVWNRLEEVMENEEIMEGKVKEAVDAGIIVDLGAGIDGFMPGSLVDINYIPDFSSFLGETLEFKVIEMNRERDKVILSRKKLMEEKVESRKKEILESLEEGQIIKGTIRRLTDFGAFVDIGGIDGLVHISEISWGRVEHPREALKVGEEIEVKVLEVNPETERISLSVRKAQPDPWESVAERYSKEDILEGKVTRIVNFGVFVEIVPGVEGLVHISQVADYHVKHPSEIVSEGDQVNVKILDIKPEDKRISLSIKEAAPPEHTGDYQDREEEDGGKVKLGDVFGELFEKEKRQEETGENLEVAREEQEEYREEEEEAGGEEISQPLDEYEDEETSGEIQQEEQEEEQEDQEDQEDQEEKQEAAEIEAEVAEEEAEEEEGEQEQEES